MPSPSKYIYNLSKAHICELAGIKYPHRELYALKLQAILPGDKRKTVSEGNPIGGTAPASRRPSVIG